MNNQVEADLTIALKHFEQQELTAGFKHLRKAIADIKEASGAKPEPLTDDRKALRELVAMIDAYKTSADMAALQENRVMRNARAALAASGGKEQTT